MKKSCPPLTEHGEPDWPKMEGKKHGLPLPATPEDFFWKEIFPDLKNGEKEEIRQFYI
jgi:hypothetical protein